MADFVAIAKQFVDYYYKQFDSNRTELAQLYRDNSMLTFEEAPFQGGTAIVEKLQNLPFQQVQHQVATLDAQPGPSGGILILVTGALLVEAEQRPMSYTQTFQLQQENGNWFVYNDIFRLVYPAA